MLYLRRENVYEISLPALPIKYQTVRQTEICTNTLPLPMGEVPRRGGEGSRDCQYDAIFRSMIGS